MLERCTLPQGLAFGGSVLALLATIFIYGGSWLAALMGATLGSALFYFTGAMVLKEFGLPADTSLAEFQRFT
jgi:hypothetical protein